MNGELDWPVEGYDAHGRKWVMVRCTDDSACDYMIHAPASDIGFDHLAMLPEQDFVQLWLQGVPNPTLTLSQLPEEIQRRLEKIEKLYDQQRKDAQFDPTPAEEE